MVQDVGFIAFVRNVQKLPFACPGAAFSDIYARTEF